MNHSFNSHRIRCISIIGGFLDGTKFELADGLNCFIGARGAGKTTMLEFVRYALDALPSREEQPTERRRIESLVEKNLAGGRVEVTIETKDGMQYTVSRSSGDEPIVLTIDRQPTDISFKTGMVFGADRNQHEVTISKDYYLGVYEVTQAQYEKVMGKNPSYFQGAIVGNEKANLPVENVAWDDAVEFCKKLSELPVEKKAGRVYRLPTEAEWEYACRAGGKTAYSFDDEPGLLYEYGWFDRNSSKRTHTVGLRESNAWGVYDMHGNVWEWCSDWHGDYPEGAITDPAGPKNGSNRVFRGGCWYYGAAFCRSALRSGSDPSYSNDRNGFRVALSSNGIPQSPEADK
jgi:formylglycine-generating enzyme required for sulfatase activity